MYREEWARTREPEGVEPDGSLDPFAGGGGGPAGSGAAADELADALGETEEGGAAEPEDSAEEPEDRLAQLEAENERLRREVEQLEELKGRQGHLLGQLRQQVGAGYAGQESVAPAQVAPQAMPALPGQDVIANAMREFLITGDARPFSQALLHQYVALRQIERVYEQSQQAEEKAFFERYPELAEGQPREVYEAFLAQTRMQLPHLAAQQQREMARERAHSLLTQMGWELEEERTEARAAARGAQTPPGRAARFPARGEAGPAGPLTPEALRQYTAEFIAAEQRKKRSAQGLPTD